MIKKLYSIPEYIKLRFAIERMSEKYDSCMYDMKLMELLENRLKGNYELCKSMVNDIISEGYATDAAEILILAMSIILEEPDELLFLVLRRLEKDDIIYMSWVIMEYIKNSVEKEKIPVVMKNILDEFSEILVPAVNQMIEFPPGLEYSNEYISSIIDIMENFEIFNILSENEASELLRVTIEYLSGLDDFSRYVYIIDRLYECLEDPALKLESLYHMTCEFHDAVPEKYANKVKRVYLQTLEHDKLEYEGEQSSNRVLDDTIIARDDIIFYQVKNRIYYISVNHILFGTELNMKTISDMTDRISDPLLRYSSLMMSVALLQKAGIDTVLENNGKKIIPDAFILKAFYEMKKGIVIVDERTSGMFRLATEGAKNIVSWASEVLFYITIHYPEKISGYMKGFIDGILSINNKDIIMDFFMEFVNSVSTTSFMGEKKIALKTREIIAIIEKIVHERENNMYSTPDLFDYTRLLNLKIKYYTAGHNIRKFNETLSEYMTVLKKYDMDIGDLLYSGIHDIFEHSDIIFEDNFDRLVYTITSLSAPPEARSSILRFAALNVIKSKMRTS